MSVYTTVRSLVKIYLKTFYKWEVSGEENIPNNGPVILVANHISNFDPLALACALDRKLHFMAKEELFRNSLLGNFFLSLGAFPVKRGGNDRQAIRKGFQIIQDGEILGVFPEGTRSKDGKLGKALPGAAMFALKSDAVVIPVGIVSKYKWFQPIHISIGNPIPLEMYKKDKITSDDLNQAIEAIMNEIKNLIEE